MLTGVLVVEANLGWRGYPRSHSGNEWWTYSGEAGADDNEGSQLGGMRERLSDTGRLTDVRAAHFADVHDGQGGGNP